MCINNSGYGDDLKVRMVYQVIPDPSAGRSNYLRVIDETGEDYLYPEDYFVMINLPRRIEKSLLIPARAKILPKQKRKKRPDRQKILV